MLAVCRPQAPQPAMLKQHKQQHKLPPLPPEWAEKARRELGEDPILTPQRLAELRGRLRGESMWKPRLAPNMS